MRGGSAMDDNTQLSMGLKMVAHLICGLEQDEDASGILTSVAWMILAAGQKHPEWAQAWIAPHLASASFTDAVEAFVRSNPIHAEVARRD